MSIALTTVVFHRKSHSSAVFPLEELELSLIVGHEQEAVITGKARCPLCRR